MSNITIIASLFTKISKYKTFLIVFGFLMISCGSIISTIIPFNNLPSPLGYYQVGTKIFTWEDPVRLEWFTAKASDFRKIVVQVWYPAVNVSGMPAPYIDKWKKRIGPIAEQIELPKMFIYSIKNVQSNSYLNAEIDSLHKPYPLIIFSHGLGGMRMQNTIQMETLASEGYVVIAIDHAYDANITLFEDGSIADYRSGAEGELTVKEFWDLRIPQINTRSEDVIFVLNKIESLIEMGYSFWGSIMMGNVGIMGHSFGGATAIISAAKDERFDVCIALDGWMVPIESIYIQSGMKVPFLYIGRPEWDTKLNYEKLDTLIANSKVPAIKLILPATKHFDYSDTPQFTPLARRLGITGKMPTIAIRDTLNNRIINFFNKYLGE